MMREAAPAVLNLLCCDVDQFERGETNVALLGRPDDCPPGQNKSHGQEPQVAPSLGVLFY
jgi:hypothetical protein